MRRSLGLVGVAAAVALVGVTAQAAAPARTWHTGITVTSNAHLTAGALAANGDAVTSGTAVVGGRWRVEVATRTGFAAGWSVRQLTGALSGGTSTVSAMNDDDAAVVLWRAPGQPVQSSVRTNLTGLWRTLAVPSGTAALGSDGFFSPTAAMNAKGQATVLWVAHEQQGWAVRSAFRSGTNAIWRATPALLPTAPVGSSVVGLQVAGNAEGDSIAAWSVRPNGSNQGTVYVAVRAAHKAWGAPTALTGPETPTGFTPSVSESIAPNGRVALAWGVSTGGKPATSQVTIATGNATTGVWSSPVAIAAGGLPRVAVNSAGALAAVWSTPVTDFYEVDMKGAVAANGTSWTAAQTLVHTSTGSESDFGHVAMAESGRAFAYWSVHVGPGARTAAVESAGADGVWTGFSKDGQTGTTLALNGPGDALALTVPYDPPVPQTIANSFDAVPRAVLTHAQWVWMHSVFIPAHFAPALRAAVWTRLTANPSAALALVHRYGPASIR
jgi:hypothetical protein